MRQQLTGITILGVLVVLPGCDQPSEGLATPQGERVDSTEIAPAAPAMSTADQIAFLRTHLEAQPDDDTARYQLGMALRQIDLNLALIEFQKISKDTPQSPLARKQVAAIYIMGGEDRLAELLLGELQSELPNDTAVAMALAELYVRNGEFREALPHARRLVELTPDRADSYLLLASVLEASRRFPDMIGPLEAVISLDPDCEGAHASLALAYHETGRLADARREAEWCFARNPNDGFIHRIMASVERDAGNIQQSWEHINLATEAAPKDVETHIVASDLLMFDGRAEEAYLRLKSFRDNQKENLRFLGALARSASAAGHKEEAQGLYQAIDAIYAQRMQQERDRQSRRGSVEAVD